MLFRTAPRKDKQDLISEVIGDARHAAPYYPPGLTEITRGPRSKFPVGFSRFYLLASPPVAVDFEPNPLDDVPQMYCEVKRKWCHEHGFVYVPIFLREKLTREQFADRLALERGSLTSAQSYARWTDPLDEARRETAEANPEILTITDEEFHRLVDEEALERIKVVTEYKRWSLPVRMRTLKKFRKEIEAEYLQKRRDGSLGRYVSYRQLAVPAR